MATLTHRQKFPKLDLFEYFDVIKNKQSILNYTNQELIGLNWRDLQLKLGSKVPSGLYHYCFKIKNDDTVYKGQIRAIGKTVLNEKPLLADTVFVSELNSIKEQIKNIGQSNGVSVDLLLSVTRQGFETQIGFLNAELTRKENNITKLESTIDKLNDELNNADEQIEELKSKTGVNQYLELAQTFLASKIGTAKKITTLKDSDPQDIPKQILLILGAVDWSQVESNVINEIIKWLEIFVTKLPLKGV